RDVSRHGKIFLREPNDKAVRSLQEGGPERAVPAYGRLGREAGAVDREVDRGIAGRRSGRRDRSDRRLGRRGGKFRPLGAARLEIGDLDKRALAKEDRSSRLADRSAADRAVVY